MTVALDRMDAMTRRTNMAGEGNQRKRGPQ
ncbi:hypothetical protein NOGI109294_04385 [Nocardiopsis gilva]